MPRPGQEVGEPRGLSPGWGWLWVPPLSSFSPAPPQRGPPGPPGPPGAEVTQEAVLREFQGMLKGRHAPPTLLPRLRRSPWGYPKLSRAAPSPCPRRGYRASVLSAAGPPAARGDGEVAGVRGLPLSAEGPGAGGQEDAGGAAGLPGREWAWGAARGLPLWVLRPQQGRATPGPCTPRRGSRWGPGWSGAGTPSPLEVLGAPICAQRPGWVQMHGSALCLAHLGPLWVGGCWSQAPPPGWVWKVRVQTL